MSFTVMAVNSADMGIDAIEPLEHPPAGNVDLAAAKQMVGDRMMLCGNVSSQWFATQTPAEVRQKTREAIMAAARGGGYALRCDGVLASLPVPDEVMARILDNVEAYILAGLEFGAYPIRSG
jgi:uroporphyrinogen-III decarboxylase